MKSPAEMKHSISVPRHPELINHMCQMDYISIDMMGCILYRTKTLATGGDCCDFHVVKKVQNGLKNRVEKYQHMNLSKVQEIVQIYN